MRLIDADALARSLCKGCSYEHQALCLRAPMCRPMALIQVAETITPGPERGSWMVTDAWPHRVHCGADMRSLRDRINGEIAGGDEE